MRRNCGLLAYDELLGTETGSKGALAESSAIAAYDSLAGATHGRVSDISMATLVQVAQDNDTFLFPMRVPTVCLLQIQLPYILLHQHHFSTIKSLEELPNDLGEHAFILHSQPMSDFIIDLVEARELRGGNWFSSIGDVFGDIGSGIGKGAEAYGKAFTDVAKFTPLYAAFDKDRLHIDQFMRQTAKDPTWGPAVQMGLNFVPYVGPAVSAGYGEYRARQTPQGMAPGKFNATRFGVNTATGYAVKGAVNYGTTGSVWGAPAAGSSASLAAADAASDPTSGGMYPNPSTASANLSAVPSAANTYGAGGYLAGGGGLMSGLGKTGMGLMAASALIPTPTPPNFYPDENQFREMMSRGPMTASGKAAAAEVQRTLGVDSTFAQQLAAMSEPFSRDAMFKVDQQYDLAAKQQSRALEAAGIRPESGLYQQSMGKVASEANNQKRILSGQVAGALGAQFLSYKEAMVGMGVQIENMQLQEVLGMTGMSANDAAMKYYANVNDINSIRGAFGKVGEMALGGAMGAYGKGANA